MISTVAQRETSTATFLSVSGRWLPGRLHPCNRHRVTYRAGGGGRPYSCLRIFAGRFYRGLSTAEDRFGGPTRTTAFRDTVFGRSLARGRPAAVPGGDGTPAPDRMKSVAFMDDQCRGADHCRTSIPSLGGMKAVIWTGCHPVQRLHRSGALVALLTLVGKPLPGGWSQLSQRPAPPVSFACSTFPATRPDRTPSGRLKV